MCQDIKLYNMESVGISYDTPAISHYHEKKHFVIIREEFDDTISAYLNNKLLFNTYIKSGVRYDGPTLKFDFKYRRRINIMTLLLSNGRKACQFYCPSNYIYIKIDRKFSAEDNRAIWLVTFSNRKGQYY